MSPLSHECSPAKLYAKSLTDEYKDQLDTAKKLADDGEPILFEASIQKVLITLEKAKKSGIKLDEQTINTKILEIKKNGYARAMEIQLNIAKRFSEEGDSTLFEGSIDNLLSFVQKAKALDMKVDEPALDAQLLEIKKNGYVSAIKNQLRVAEKFSKKGETVIFEHSIGNVLYCAQQANALGIKLDKEAIDTKILEIKENGYTQAIETQLVLAEDSAEKGDIIFSESLINKVSDCMQKAKKLDIKINENAVDARILAIKDKLNAAEKIMEKEFDKI